MRKFVFLVLIPLLWESAFATDNIGSWNGKSASGSNGGGRQFVQFQEVNKVVTLNILTDEDFRWDEGDTVAAAVAGVTGSLNITNWTSESGYFWYKHASSKTNVDVWIQSAPTDSGPWVNQLQLIDSARTTSAVADSLDLTKAGPYIRFSYVNEDSCLKTAEVDYLYLKLTKP